MSDVGYKRVIDFIATTVQSDPDADEFESENIRIVHTPREFVEAGRELAEETQRKREEAKSK